MGKNVYTNAKVSKTRERYRICDFVPYTQLFPREIWTFMCAFFWMQVGCFYSRLAMQDGMLVCVLLAQLQQG